MRGARQVFIWVAFLLGGCAADEADVSRPTAPDADAPPALADAGPPDAVASPDAATVTAGIPTCADRFRAPDGRCAPRLAHCPPGQIPGGGWSECVSVGVNGPDCPAVFVEPDGRCRPSQAKCPEGTWADMGRGCVPIDGEAGCGEGPYGDVDERAGDVHVDAAAAAEGADGSRARPFPTVAAALAAVTAGGRVVLAAGDYAEAVRLPANVGLVGRCPSMVTLRGGAPAGDRPDDDLAVVLVLGAEGASVRRVTLADWIGLDVERSTGVVVEDVVFRNNLYGGLHLEFGSSVEARRLLFLDTPPPQRETLTQSDVVVSVMHSTLRLGGATIARSALGAVAVRGREAALELEDALVEDAARNEAFRVREGARVTLRRVAAIGVGAGILVHEGGGGALEVRRSLFDSTGVLGANAGVRIETEDVRATFEGNELRGAGERGLFVQKAGTTASLAGNLVVGTRGRNETTAGGLVVGEGASVESTGDAFVDNEGAAVHVRNDEGGRTSLAVAESLVEGSRAHVRAGRGQGVVVRSTSGVRIARSAVVGNTEAALVAAGAGATLDVEESLVEGTRPGRLPDGSPGLGVGAHVSGVAVATFTRCHFRENHMAAVVASGSFDVVTNRATECLFEDTLPGAAMDRDRRRLDGLAYGVVVTDGGTMEVEGCRLAGPGAAALLYDDSKGAIAGTSAAGAEYGLAVQGERRPTYDERDPGLAPILAGGALPVPSVETPLPR